MGDLNSLATLVGYEPEHYARSGNRRDRIAVKCGDRSVTWGQLGERVHRLASAWENRGFQPGDRVATFLTNRVEVIEIMYSLARVSMVNATVNAKFKAEEFVNTVAFADVSALVVDSSLLGVVDQAIVGLPHIDRSNVFVVDGQGIEHAYATFEDLLASGDDAPIQRVPDEYDTMWMAFTGGTTGPSKACMASHRAMAHMWAVMSQDFDVRRSDVGLIASSLNHALGVQFGMALLHLGGTLIVLPEFNPVTVLETIEAEKITFIPSAPSLFNMILDAGAAGSYDVSSMRLVVTGGAPVSTTTRNRLLDYFANADLTSGYGGTESGLFSIVYPEDQRIKPQSAGVAPLGVELAILDEEGRVCAPGEMGTIYQRGWHTAVEYYKNPEATAAQFRGEWFTLDDMGYLDEDGYLYITDRRKNMIVSSGANVFPAEIENVLAGHPDVAEVGVIGIPDETWGEVVCAIVVLRLGAEPDVDALDNYCRERLARYKVPRRFEFRTELPKTYAGKLSHRELRAPYWADRSARV
jgi:acyl-CoA synthetase (AMP-forming)/AMP-acid ligase II